VSSFDGSRKTCLLVPRARGRVCKLVVSVPCFCFQQAYPNLPTAIRVPLKSCNFAGYASGWFANPPLDEVTFVSRFAQQGVGVWT